MTVQISPLLAHDVALLQRISRQTFVETFGGQNTEADMQQYLHERLSAERLSQELAHPSSYFYLATVDGEPAGYLKLNTGEAQTEAEAPEALEVERIYVLRAHQHEGIGQALLTHALTVAIQMYRSYVWLGVWEHNEKAIRFYRRNHFEVYSRHVFTLGSDPQTDLMMRRTLTY